MIRCCRLILTVSLAAVLVALIAPTRAAEEPKPPAKQPDVYPTNATAAEKQEIDLRRLRGRDVEPAMRDRLLAAYPFASLESRLKFDATGRKRVTNTFPTPDLDLAAAKLLHRKGEMEKVPPAALATLLAEDRLSREAHFDRVRGLATLHQLEVAKFVTNPGFGYMRLVSDRYTRLPETPAADWSEGDRGEPVTLPKTGGFFIPSEDKKGPTLPSVIALGGFHTSTAHEFARPDSWGLVKDRTQVAGFLPHVLEFVPDGNVRRRFDTANPNKDATGRITGYPVIERWAVRKVELIGLLMHDAPVVYLTPEGKLPSMKAVKEAKTRELTEFESNALKALAAGKEVVTVDAVTNHIRMVGGIRMAEACMKCHEGKRGDLLGAFSYDLVRDPAYIPPEK